MNHLLEKLFEMLFIHYYVVNATALLVAAFSYTKDKIKIMATYFVLYYFLKSNSLCAPVQNILSGFFLQKYTNAWLDLKMICSYILLLFNENIFF